MNQNVESYLKYSIDNYISLCGMYVFVEKFLLHEKEIIDKYKLKNKDDVKKFILKLYEQKAKLN